MRIAVLIALVATSLLSDARAQIDSDPDFAASNCRVWSTVEPHGYGFARSRGLDRDRCVASQLQLVLRLITYGRETEPTRSDQGYVEFRALDSSPYERCSYNVTPGVRVPLDIINLINGWTTIPMEDSVEFYRQRDLLNERIQRIVHVECMMF